MTDKVNDEARRQAFISDEANLELAADDLAEAIRDLLRALAAKDPSEPISRASGAMLSILRVYRGDFPAEQVLTTAVARLTSLDDERSQHGSIIDTARSALRYFAEATATDNFSQARLGKAHRRYADDIVAIDTVNKLRREIDES